MPAKVLNTEFGHSAPPEGPHTITTHIQGWDNIMRLREGDKAVLARVTSIYPRFAPWNKARELPMKIREKLALPPTHSALAFVNPDIFATARLHAFSPHRGEKKLSAGDLGFRVVDIHGVRLYVVTFPLDKYAGIIGVWKDPGTGVSTRLAEYLLPHVDTLEEVPFDGSAGGEEVPLPPPPPPTWLPECEAHGKLRERIAGLLHRAALQPEAVKVQPDDVYLYPSGMASIYRACDMIGRWRRGPIVALGSIFHSTWHLFNDSVDGFRHFGACDASGNALEELEVYLRDEAKEGRKTTFVFLEFPSNPILVSADLKRLRQLADTYDFLLVVDDTVGSFCNIDVLPVADIVMTSTTKSFSGYADVMGGSLVLNPVSPHYAPIKAIFGTHFRNEYFAGDAEKLLSNSADFLARSAILNRNARTLADFFHARSGAADPSSAITRVLYPTLSDTLANYEAAMRRPTPEFPAPGHGCLLSVEFETKDCARAFFDGLAVHHGPHLGAHVTLAVPFNEMLWGRDPEGAAYHAAYGVRAEQVRISVGLESEEELLGVVEEALERVRELKAAEGDGDGS